MAFFGLFKTKAEKRAYAIGREHERQSCKAKRMKQPKVKTSKLKCRKRKG